MHGGTTELEALTTPVSLRVRGLRPLIVGQGVSALGSQMTFFALPWFVLATTGSAARMGVVFAVELVPVALLGIPSGSVVGRLGARRTMQIADGIHAPLVAAVPILHAVGLLSFPLLLVLVALTGVFIAPYFASQRLMLPELLGDDEVAVSKANAVVEGISRLASLLGPATAGALIPLVGAPNVLYADAATFAFSFLVLTFLVPGRRPVPATDESRGILAGLRYLIRDPLLRVLGATALVANGLGMMLVAALVVLARDEFDAPTGGAFFASFGIGAVMGSLAAMKLVGRFEPLRLGAVAFVLLTLPTFALALPLPALGVMSALAVSSFFGPLVNAPLIMVITTRTPEALRAKVTTAVITTAMLAGPLGYLIAGLLLDAWGPYRIFLVVAAGQLLATLPFAAAAFRQPLRASPTPTPTPSI